MSLNKTYPPTELSRPLIAELAKAKEACRSSHEEQGGFILEKDDQYQFIQISNAFSGLPKAKSLYEANKKEFGERVVTLLINGWNMHASFHTHPNGYSANPSSIDLQNLFLANPTNYIYATKSDELVRYQVAKIIEDGVFSNEYTSSFISLLPSETNPNKTAIWRKSYVR